MPRITHRLSRDTAIHIDWDEQTKTVTSVSFTGSKIRSIVRFVFDAKPSPALRQFTRRDVDGRWKHVLFDRGSKGTFVPPFPIPVQMVQRVDPDREHPPGLVPYIPLHITTEH